MGQSQHSPLQKHNGNILRPASLIGLLAGEQSSKKQQPLRPERRQHNWTGVSSISRQESICNPPYAHPKSQGSSAANSDTRRQDARDLFEEYGVRPPLGWLSEDSARSSHRHGSELEVKICHACHLMVPDRKECGSCGHDSCLKCSKKSPFEPPSLGNITESESFRDGRCGSTEHRSAPHYPVTTVPIAVHPHRHRSNDGASTPRVSIRSEARDDPVKPMSSTLEGLDNGLPGRRKTSVDISDHVAKNPFIQADRNKEALSPTTSNMNAKAKGSPHLSNCVPRRHMGYSHEGPLRLVLSSALDQRESQIYSRDDSGQQSVPEQLVSRDDSSTKSSARGYQRDCLDSLEDPLEKKIHQLCHHGEDLYNSQHILEHLAAGSSSLHGETVASRRTLASEPQEEQAQSSESAGHRVHSLADDEVGQPTCFELHELDIDNKISLKRQPTRSRLHSLSVDQLGVEQRLARHSLLQDPMVDVELSPKSPAVGDHLMSRAQDWHRSYSWRPHTPTFELPASKLPISAQKSRKTAIRKPASPGFKPPSPKAWLNRTSSRDNTLRNTIRWVHDDDMQVRPRYSTQEISRISRDRDCKLFEELRHHEGHDFAEEKPEQWPRLRRVDKPVTEAKLHSAHATKAPWVDHTLRKVTHENGEYTHDAKRSEQPQWRQRLRKVDQPIAQNVTKKPTSSVPQWRHSLSRVPTQTHFKGNIQEGDDCGHCHPSQASQATSSTHDESAGVCLVLDQGESGNTQHVITSQSNQAHGRDQIIDQSFSTPSRLRLRDLEHSLARQSAEDLLQSQRHSPGRRPSSVVSQDILRKEANLSTIHNPRPMLALDHTCE